MPNDPGVKTRWLNLSKALDTSWSSLYDIGAALARLIDLGLSSNDFPEAKSLEELSERQKAADREMTEEEYESLSFHQKMVKIWWDSLSRSQSVFVQAERDLKKEVATMPSEILALLDALHQRPWRAHFRRFYLDSLRELPAPIRDFRLAFYEEEGIPAVFHRTTLPAQLKTLLFRAEVHSPFAHWARLVRRAQMYAADLHAIRDEIGGELPDGPSPGLRWRHEGKLVEEQMLPGAWKLANFMWRKQPTAFDKCAEPVFGDRDEEVDENRIGSHRRNANNFFKANSIPWIIRTKQKFVIMTQTNWAAEEDPASQESPEQHPGD